LAAEWEGGGGGSKGVKRRLALAGWGVWVVLACPAWGD